MKLIHWLKNYWYYYKFHTFAALFILIVAGTLIWQSATAKEPDLCVYYLTRDPVVYQEDLKNLSTAVSRYTDDRNGDGTVYVQVVNYFLSDEYEENDRTTFSNAYVAGGILLILADEYSMNYLKDTEYFGDNVSSLTDDTVFDGCGWSIADKPFSESPEMKYFSQELFFTLRVYNEKSWIQILPGTEEAYRHAEAVLGRIIRDEKIAEVTP